MITCPNCGGLQREDINLYNVALRRQSFALSPILPVCNGCGAEVKIEHTARGGSILFINGTCGSGKTTIAEILAEQGFLAIDGDCAIESLRHKKGCKQYEWAELREEIAREVDVLSLFGEDIVIAHIVMPEDMDWYAQMAAARGMQCRFILLRPAYEAAVERCRTRTCHQSVTPEQWIRHFYDLLVSGERVQVVDNTAMTAEETAALVLRG